MSKVAASPGLGSVKCPSLEVGAGAYHYRTWIARCGRCDDGDGVYVLRAVATAEHVSITSRFSIGYRQGAVSVGKRGGWAAQPEKNIGKKQACWRMGVLVSAEMLD